jgi:hypothetical protein
LVTLQACAMPEQTPVLRLQVKPSRQPALLVQDTTHLPATQFSFALHCEPSKHWLAGAVHTPPPVGPAMQIEPLAQVASVSHALAGPAQVPPLVQV